MLKEKAALFTIGQFAALHEINKKTLMWYDEIGLLKPACIKENGYRYYSYQQSAALETILMLRELNVSLDEIKQFMENRTIDNFASLLQEKITELNQTISHLRSIQKILINQQQDMDMLRSLDIAEISLVEKQSRYLVAVDMAENLSFEQEIERVIAETKKHQLRRLHDASYGAMLPVEHLYQGKFSEYSATVSYTHLLTGTIIYDVDFWNCLDFRHESAFMQGIFVRRVSAAVLDQRQAAPI